MRNVRIKLNVRKTNDLIITIVVNCFRVYKMLIVYVSNIENTIVEVSIPGLIKINVI